MSAYPHSIFWFRRDLRLNDNHALYQALSQSDQVLPVFIFDTHILKDLRDPQDKRVQFIYQELCGINKKLEKRACAVRLYFGEPVKILEKLCTQFHIHAVFANEDYEPYGRTRDRDVAGMLNKKKIPFHLFQDHVICRPDEILKHDGKPYTIYTPYMNKWREGVGSKTIASYPSEKLLNKVTPGIQTPTLSLEAIGFQSIDCRYPDRRISGERLRSYARTRDRIPDESGTSHLGIHLRFGTISIRELFQQALSFRAEVFINELIWREFFIQILFHFPRVVHSSFKPQYEGIPWRNDPGDFKLWCQGQTGYALVDAGMKHLNKTGQMHNRVRMLVASFLCKHLLIDWRWGEAYFAEKLLDYELASNNGNWQWAAGSGCDAAPYFRIFNPEEQRKKFDPQSAYVLKWAPEYGEFNQPVPMVDHRFARERALMVYKRTLEESRQGLK
ncbi:MAG TPA: deoxyribodipyrimidine photo-lyase [Saprospiraceae bacterium]|nr:deoxyribodipyrimidine photo-lyase [Saprospiraceae bacterium]HNT21499.1 deoxyribodipyrimidine photo-lyase [Saprospiraceae bacterium]